jgi:hypothetical protein
MSFERYFRKTSDGETSFLDLRTTHDPNIARNGNLGSIQAYSLFGRFLVTGLIGALLSTFFRIPVIRAWNQKSPVLRGGKPALLFPIGWQIAVQMGWSRGKGKRRAVLGMAVFRVSGIPHKTRRKPALLPAPRLRRRVSSPEGFPTPKIALIREKTALMFSDIRGIKPVWQSGAIFNAP